jgi:hypothetical protein
VTVFVSVNLWLCLGFEMSCSWEEKVRVDNAEREMTEDGNIEDPNVYNQD